MKKVLSITLLFIVISCSNAKREAPFMDSDTTEASPEVYPIENISLEKSFTYLHLTQQKLQDYYDLVVLLKQHPEFKDDITSQLRELSKSEITPNYMQQVRIENVQQLGKSEQISDSIQKINIQFDIVGKNNTKIDTTTAIIKTKKIIVDNKDVVSTKIVFIKEQIDSYKK